MNDHPILFQPDMVRAIMTCSKCGTITLDIECPKCGSKERRKFETRRVVKRLRIHADYGEPDWNKTWIDDSYDPPCLKVAYGGGKMGPTTQRHWHPYAPGELLCVRETWRVNSVGYYCREHKKNHNINIEFATLPGDARGGDINICGDEDMLVVAKKYYDKHTNGRYTPSIFMPKWACRNWLKVLAGGVERVQEISARDAIREGIRQVNPNSGSTMWFDDYCGGETVQPCVAFKGLWDSINAKPKPRYAKIDGKKEIIYYESYPWKAGTKTGEYRGKPWHVRGNPFVWKTTFERYDK